MTLVTKRELLQLTKVHYILELALALAYVILKSIPSVSLRMFGTSEYSSVSCPNNAF